MNIIVPRKLIGMALFLALAIGRGPSDVTRPDCHCPKPGGCHMPASRGDCCVVKSAPDTATATVPAVRAGGERPDSVGVPASPEPFDVASSETAAIARRLALAPPGATRSMSPLRL